ncbi:MAG: AEC family transporter [Ignavibacteriales bacterium]|nr:AEC family transporter [Ignavibacteriales bacterium]
MFCWLDSFLFIAATVFPVFIIILLGYFLFIRKIINKEFNSAASRLVFNIALPCLVFKEIANAPLDQMIDTGFVAFIYVATFLSAMLAWVIGLRFRGNGASQGAFVQGSFRGNFAIIGLALLGNTGNSLLMTKGAIALAFILPFYNVLSILVLALPLKQEKGITARGLLKEIYTNPLIIALLMGVLFSLLKIPLPDMVFRSAGYLSSMAMPLALIGIGASLAGSNIRHLPSGAFLAATLKVCIFPLILTVIAFFCGYKGDDLMVLFILFSSPTAIVSYIMADAMGSDSYMAGAIILISTILSIGSISIGLIILKSYALI